ncbi:MAG: hypothetical protein ACXVAR_17835 [Vulcanimicrobiaceae bacterium]
MVRTLLRTSVAFVLAASVGILSGPAYADGTGGALATGVVQSANIAIKNAENAHKKEQQHLPDGTVGQVPPVGQKPVGGPAQLGLPTGFTYTLDLSAAYPFGDIGGTGNRFLWGGLDGVVAYGFNPTTRVVANYYELQHYPVGFNSGIHPACIQGLPNCASADLATINPQINVTTKDKFWLLNFEKLFAFHLKNGRVLPIVLTPTYVARTSDVAASHGNSDIVPFWYNGFPVYGVHTRTAQVYSLAATLPFLKTPKMFGTFTLAPSYLVHTAGINQQNTAQLYQILYIEYTPTSKMKFFFEPQSSRDYLPTDPFAQHLFAYFLGISQQVGTQGFVQLILNGGGPTNEGAYGVNALYCQQAGNCANTTVPQIGGLKATQVQLQIGIGSPSVIQF